MIESPQHDLCGRLAGDADGLAGALLDAEFFESAPTGVRFGIDSESHSGATGSQSEASFSWSHAASGAPRGVAVFVLTFSATQTVTGVTYGGVAMTLVGSAVDTAGEPGRVDAYFLGSGLPTGAQDIVVSRANNAVVMYAAALTVDAAANTETTGLVLDQEDMAVVERYVDDGRTGGDPPSLRVGYVYTGAASPIGAGPNSTRPASFDLGAQGGGLYYETTPGVGSRPVGAGTGAVNDDTAGIYFAIRETTGSAIATGRAEETDSALAVLSLKRRTAQTATEVDSVQSLARRKSKTVGQAGEADTALGLGRRKSKASGLASDSNTAFALAEATGVPVGTAPETNAAFGLARRKSRSAGLASTLNTATPLASRKARACAASIDSDGALSLARAKRRTVVTGGEIDAAVALTLPEAQAAGQFLIQLARRRARRRR